MNTWPFEGSDWDLTQLSSQARGTSIKSFLFQNICNFWILRFLENFQIFGKISDIWKNFRFSDFRFSDNFQIFEKISDVRKFFFFRFSDNFQTFRNFSEFLETFGFLEKFQIFRIFFFRFSEFGRSGQSGHVSSSLWSNVSMVSSLWDCSLYGKSKRDWVSQSVSEWQGHLLSCSGQL